MLRERRMEISRDTWKKKARVRADELRDMRKARRRDRDLVKQLREENILLKDEAEKHSDRARD